MTKRSKLVLIAAAVCVMAACGADPEPAPMQTVTPTTAAGSPVAAGEATPEFVAPTAQPVLPEAATQHTVEGAEAFLTHWFETLNWAQAANDTTYLKTISASDCGYCQEVFGAMEERVQAGGQQERGLAAISDLSLTSAPSDNSMIFDLTYAEESGRLVLPDGVVLKDWEAVQASPRQAAAVWNGDSWEFAGFGQEVTCSDCAPTSS